MKPWTAPLLVASLMCLLLINTAGYPICIHASAPEPTLIFGWPKIYLWTDLSPSQWAQVRVDNSCACGKPIHTSELPWQQPEMSQINSSALLWNIFRAIILLSYLAIVLELLQCRFIQRPFTIRGGLFLTALLAVITPLSRSKYIFPFYVEHIRFWMWFKLLSVIFSLGLLAYLIAITLLEKSETRRIAKDAEKSDPVRLRN